MTTERNKTMHPCFNKDVKGECGRVHLPVAPKCNVLCNFCNRKFDCVNESRPGVTSAVLSPGQAAKYMEDVLAKEPRITVAGIAGPGDPFANPLETLGTMRRIREKFPDLLFCVSTNGLALPPYLDDVADLGVTHMTVTVNAVDPVIGGEVYKWVRDGKVVYRGKDAGKLILERQLESIRGLKARGITVKVNTIIIPGINDHHVEEIARVMKGLDVDLHNLIPMYPNPGTGFGHLPEPTKAEVNALRKAAGVHVPQMTHCKRCRADAVGLLDNDISGEMAGCLSACSKMELPVAEARPYVAVATREGMLVNQHLGEASRFQIWAEQDGALSMVEERQSPPAGCGPKRWEALAKTLKDCSAIFCAAAGETPSLLLEESGIQVEACTGFISDVLSAHFGDGDLAAFKARKGGCAMGCGGAGGGEGCG
ncbi:radical SAM protein [Desulfovibrio ferrophilus]|uniref:FeMo cofactor biosynthesis protein NifB n=1 Tax=Desulfovibrio ferrophilus TaxID=241368 RepID=A0A2Z6AYB3_9BACT|nr:radical SAM protein [Desulfovibrio ferrophilus]BBD08208.1 nitrogenase cofactor biosynthesis protein NifB [Desulfovibrio ferrophilus]